ncbi:hypothetical protein OFB63_34955, partial [Escherichia coli]|nr:hypothetical protein [Escherichia coli]
IAEIRLSAHQSDVLISDFYISTPEKIPAFAADCYHRNIFGFILFDESLRRFNDIGIESTGKAFIAADEDYQVILVAALIKQ